MIKTKLALLIDLARLNRPIGIYLLLWPTMTALWLAQGGIPSTKLFLIFLAGTILMRSAGCIINDIADAKWDNQVERTKNRPLTNGKLSKTTALITFCFLCAVAFGLVCLTNTLSILFSIIAFATACLYPYTKRFTHFPQFFLGAAFSMGIPIAYAASQNHIPFEAWILYGFNVIWTLAYDTQYAVIDRKDDLQAGIKSSAVFFGQYVRAAIAGLQLCALIALSCFILTVEKAVWLWLGAAGMAACFLYQYWLTQSQEPKYYFQAFLNNHWAGLALFAGTGLHFWLTSMEKANPIIAIYPLF